jgi:hypothetical protein
MSTPQNPRPIDVEKIEFLLDRVDAIAKLLGLATYTDITTLSPDIVLHASDMIGEMVNAIHALLDTETSPEPDDDEQAMGWVLRPDLEPPSGIDELYTFAQEHCPGLIRRAWSETLREFIDRR